MNGMQASLSMPERLPEPVSLSAGQAKLLVIGSLRAERRTLAAYMAGQGLSVTEAEAPQAAVGAEDYDVILIVASLPNPLVSGFIRRLAETDGAPILVMSETGEYVERVLALELGADDLVARETNPRELLARLRGLMRRRRREDRTTWREDVGVRWTLQVDRRILLTPMGRRIDLSRTDLALVSAFADSAGSPVRDIDLPGGSLRTTISRLRQRAVSHAQTELPIRNIRGSGYRFDAPLIRS